MTFENSKAMQIGKIRGGAFGVMQNYDSNVKELLPNHEEIVKKLLRPLFNKKKYL
jgi:hypothetical protein